jgi:hypothetical protein
VERVTSGRRVLLPALGTVLLAAACDAVLLALGSDTRGFSWLVAGLLGGFSLSGSV